MGDLVVELHGRRIGRLAGDWRTFDFHAEPEAVARYGLDSVVLSVAVPLSLAPTRSGRAARQAFFHGLLPEGRMLTRMAELAGVAQYDAVGLLRRFGRDIAGALQIWDPENPDEPLTPRSERIADAEIARLLGAVAVEPLGNGSRHGKTSLAGVQDKIVLAWEEGWFRAYDGYPSTHILKPVTSRWPTMIFDEEYGSRFARALGLASHATSIREFDGVPALVIERYDRREGSRVHQEDFAQALGLMGDEKYQRYSGRARLARIAGVLREYAPDSLIRLAAMVTASVALGNLDLHAKNLSLVHGEDGRVELAPAYDWVPMAQLPTDGELAMAVGGEYRHSRISVVHLEEELASWGLRDYGVVERTLRTVRDLARAERPEDGASAGLQGVIESFADRLLRGEAAGPPVV